MVQKIVWKKRAKISFDRIIDFLLLQWNEDVADDFAQLVDSKIDALSKTPEIGLLSEFSGFRKTIIHEHLVLFYEFFPGENLLELHLFWDTREDPDKIKF